MRRSLRIRLLAYPAALVAAGIALWFISIRMPGRSHSGPLPPLTPAHDTLAANLRRHVDMLAGRIGERHADRLRALDSAAAYVAAQFKSLGYTVAEQTYEADGKTFRNIEIALEGTTRAKEIVVIGAHYDAVAGTPGADDNASGTAAILEMARLLRSEPRLRTIRIVAFTNEEPPMFFTEDMGSRRYARAAKARGDDIVAMISMETIGYYSDKSGSQKYPPILGWFYPSKGDFIGVVGNISSRSLVHRVIRDFREFAAFPSVGTAAPMQIPGISWSDHWSFWKEGYKAVMITDTAPFRNANYHELTDRPDSLNYDHMARVVQGVARTISEIATASDR